MIRLVCKYLSFSELNSVDTTESIELVEKLILVIMKIIEYYLQYFRKCKVLKNNILLIL